MYRGLFQICSDFGGIRIRFRLVKINQYRFQFEESVSTFTAGLYSMRPGVKSPALVYVTFNNKIQVC